MSTKSRISKMSFGSLKHRQNGAVTMFSAVLILILLTEMVLYAVQVGVFEQRKSSNDALQKEAFHIADSALHFGKEYMVANSRLISSQIEDVLADGSDGWLSAAGPHWRKCSEADLGAPKGRHPCYAEPADNDSFVADLRANSYFFMTDVTGDPNDLALAELPIDVTGLLSANDQDVSLYALLCMFDVDTSADPIVQGCTIDSGAQDSRFFMVTLLAVGEADCEAGTCTAKALIADRIAGVSPGGGAGGPAAPLTTRSNFPPQGNVDVVPNPNGGGVGVPVSVWIDDQAIIDGWGSSWSTCERQEWYGVDVMPLDYLCPDVSDNCSCQGKRQISYPVPGDDPHLGVDMVPDEKFPPDLFEYMFGVPGDADGADFVRGLAETIIDLDDPKANHCTADLLNYQSHGLIWVEGNCSLPGQGNYLDKLTQIGTVEAPVFLVLAGEDTSFSGNIDIFGTVFITDSVNVNAEITGTGTPTVYGSMVIDAGMDKFQGRMKLVYLENVIQAALDGGLVGTVAGAWSDFHQDWR